jgi:hypothetical protein
MTLLAAQRQTAALNARIDALQKLVLANDIKADTTEVNARRINPA